MERARAKCNEAARKAKACENECDADFDNRNFSYVKLNSAWCNWERACSEIQDAVSKWESSTGKENAAYNKGNNAYLEIQRAFGDWESAWDAWRRTQDRLDEAKDTYDESEYDKAYDEYEAGRSGRQVMGDAAYGDWTNAKDDCYSAWDAWEDVKTR